MTLEALDEIITNSPEILEGSAVNYSSEELIVMGIARFAIANGYEALSANQKTISITQLGTLLKMCSVHDIRMNLRKNTTNIQTFLMMM